MKLNSKPALFGLLLAIALASACGDDAYDGVSRPNVVLIIVDTLRADVIEDLPGVVNTPELDRFAAEGIPFTRAYTHAPMTLPAHTALFSSRLPVEAGVLNNSQNVPADLPLLAESMQKFGYSTRAVISLGTLTPPAQNEGLRRGFDEYDVDFTHIDVAADVEPRLNASLESWPAFTGEEERPFFLFAHFCDPHAPYHSHGSTEENGVVRLDGKDLGSYALGEVPSDEYELDLEAGEHTVEIASLTNALLRVKALNVTAANGEEVPVEFTEGELVGSGQRVEVRFTVAESGRFTLRVGMHDRPGAKEAKRRYIREVEHVDAYVGRLLQALRDQGEYDNTMIVFVSDHGEALGENGGFVGHVRSLDDTMIRVPLIVKPPLAGGSMESIRARSGEPVSLIDLTPTILEVCGLPPLHGQRGESLLRETRSRPFEHVAETHKPEAQDDRVSLFDGTMRMLYIADEDRLYLYDISVDPGEKNDLFEERGGEFPEWPKRLRLIAEEAAAIMAGTADPDSERAAALKAMGY
ncbi:MAG: arylsulfatase [Planctomycetota bacterium]|jgi:arylsulfatase